MQKVKKSMKYYYCLPIIIIIIFILLLLFVVYSIHKVCPQKKCPEKRSHYPYTKPPIWKKMTVLKYSSMIVYSLSFLYGS